MSKSQNSKLLDDLMAVEWLEVRCGAAYVGIDDLVVGALSLYRNCGMSAAEIAEELTTPRYPLTGENVWAAMCRAAYRIQRIRGFGLWSVLAEEFRVPVGAVSGLLMSSRFEKWREL